MGGAWYEELQSSVKSMTEEELGAMAVDALFTQLGIRGSISKLQVSINKVCPIESKSSNTQPNPF